MEFNIKPGVSHIESQKVTPETTAAFYGSGMVEVFATPAMVALMEKAAMNTVQPLLPDGFNTVGIEICIKHIKATPKGMKVNSKATLTQIEGKRLVFDVVAWDEEGEIGNGTHTRYIIESEKFMAKLFPKK